jgi:two-component system chemotaxis response regulator CheB
MTKKIRVLVVDDAVVVRRIMSDLLGADPEIEVVGTAANGRIALQKLKQLSPDLITLDVEMPDMDGLETLKAIRKTHPRLPVIMLSAHTARAAAATLDALAYGASDYVCKPAAGDRNEPLRVPAELLLKIRALCSGPDRPAAESGQPALCSRAHWSPAEDRPSAVAVIAIGVSTGGPNALAEIIPKLPASLGVPIVIVQHMPPMFTKLLADRLNSLSAVTVIEAHGGEVLRAGTVYIAPGDSHLILERHGQDVLTALSQDPPENSCRPSVDAMFRSVCRVFGARALGVVLTGMGQDGLRGSEHLVGAGGHVIVQDEETSVVWGMPGMVSRAGLADRELPLPEIAGELIRRTSSLVATRPGGTARRAH